MKTYDEYMDNIQRKAKTIKKRRRIRNSSVCTVLVLALGLTLFWPKREPSVEKYKNSPYYQAIQGVNHATYKKPAYKNNYQWLKGKLSSLFKSISDDKVDQAPNAGGSTGGLLYDGAGDQYDGVNSEQSYVETTDNQVEGVIEGDLFKRSDKYLYYLRPRTGLLSVYSIEQEDSREVGTFQFSDFTAYTAIEMYLSADCKTLTIVFGVYSNGDYIILTTLDVSDPENISQTNQVMFAGSDYSARMIDNDLLLTYRYYVNESSIDYEEPSTFVPVYGNGEELQPVDADVIYCPENPTSAVYTVVVKLDAVTLEKRDMAALFGYSNTIYVSKDNIYLTCSSNKTMEDGFRISVTEITGLCYSGEGLKRLGTVQLDGTVRNQYSMDEFEGILRVTTSTSKFDEFWGQDGIITTLIKTAYNCNLYCIDLETWETVASVIAFAPEGEQVVSARFDGINAYICTAELSRYTDPVYAFDLSDINNITYKHTPVIDGYSSSLINFGDYLLGIGINENRELKVEVYRETENGVEPVDAFERDCYFSTEYKSYYIDRENDLVGIPLMDYQTWVTSYVLLQFDGQQLNVVQEIEMSDSRWSVSLPNVRADIIDGYLYILGNTLQVVKVQ